MGKPQSKEQSFTEKGLGANFHEKHQSLNKSHIDNVLPIGDVNEEFGKLENSFIKGTGHGRPVEPAELERLPFSAVVKLEMRFNDHIYGGSGAIVGPRHVLTAAHNIYDASKKWVSSVKIVSVQTTANKQSNDVFVCYIYKLEDCDLALLVLDTNIRNPSECFQLDSIDNVGSELKKQKLGLTGYPFTENGNMIMHNQQGDVKKHHEKTISYNISTSSGHSGSPLWIRVGNRYVVIGVHSQGGGDNKGLNHGVAITKETLQNLRKWIHNTSNNQVDDQTQRDEVEAYRSENLGDELIKKMTVESLMKKWKELFLIEDKNVELKISRNVKQIENITGEMIEDLIKQVASKWEASSQLWKKFTLNLNGCYRLTDNNLKNISFFLSKDFENLETFHFDCSVCQPLTDQGVNDFSQAFNSLCNLKALHINFTACPKITDAGINDLTRQMGDKLSNLQDISLNFSKLKQVTDNGVASISNNILTRRNNILNLHLNFSACEEITDEGVKRIVEKLAPGLNYLRLNFTGCRKITDVGLGYFSNTMNVSLESLEILNLCFAGCEKIRDAGLNLLTKQIGSHIINLKELKLDLTACIQITDEGIKNLLNHIQSLTKIENLALDFSLCKNISDKAVKNSADHICKHMENIQILSLDFNSCMQITDDGVKYLAEEFRKRHGSSTTPTHLQKLYLGFSKCPKITLETEKEVRSLLLLIKSIDIKF